VNTTASGPESITELLAKLSASRFRTCFRLSDRDRAYIADRGLAVISAHALDFIRSRLAPAVISNDGRQTPFRGHPVFIAQHASATCCRKCLNTWHRIARNRQLDEDEILYIHDVIIAWIQRQLA
jgi:hypothetical protein